MAVVLTMLTGCGNKEEGPIGLPAGGDSKQVAPGLTFQNNESFSGTGVQTTTPGTGQECSLSGPATLVIAGDGAATFTLVVKGTSVIISGKCSLRDDDAVENVFHAQADPKTPLSLTFTQCSKSLEAQGGAILNPVGTTHIAATCLQPDGTAIFSVSADLIHDGK
jgi:hypothetical protein